MCKLYLARGRGRLEPRMPRVVNVPITTTSDAGKTWHTCALKATHKHGRTQAACTFFLSIAYDAGSDTSLILCQPRTGRPHQIRLHLQHIGHPIANDPLYCSDARTIEDRRAFEGNCAQSNPSHAPTNTCDTICRRDDDIIWLHAWCYSCSDSSRAFHVEAPLPLWTSPFTRIAVVDEYLTILADVERKQMNASGWDKPSSELVGSADQTRSKRFRNCDDATPYEAREGPHGHGSVMI